MALSSGMAILALVALWCVGGFAVLLWVMKGPSSD